MDTNVDEEIEATSVRINEVSNTYKPKKHKAKIVIWSDLTLEATTRLMNCKSYDHVRELLAGIFMLDNSKHNLKDGVILDLYYYALQFAREENFSVEKTSTLFSIVKRIFDVSRETPYGNLDYTYEYFKELLYCHSFNRPPNNIELFTHDDVVKISNYVLNTFFRNFKLYKYVFTPTVRLDLTFTYLGALPPSPPEAEMKTQDSPLEEKMLLDQGTEAEDIDPEKLLAEEELKRIVTEFLTKEAKKVEGNIDQHLKVAAEALHARIEPMIETVPKATAKGKKK